MIEVHILDAWIVPGGRVGLSQALADEAHARKGLDPVARRRAALGRGLWLLGVGYLFRLFSYVTGNALGSPAWGFPFVLGVDVLAVAGFGMTMAVKLGAWHPRRPRLAVWGGLALVLASFLLRGPRWRRSPPASAAPAPSCCWRPGSTARAG